MSYKIVVDSCCDLPAEYKNDPRFEFVPLILQVGDSVIVDDDTFDQEDYLAKVAASEDCPKTACPSPDLFVKAYQTDADDVYVVTLTSKLSGSYNSALLAKNIYHEEYGEKNIYIADSLSASCGEALIALKIAELADKGLKFEEIIPEIEAYRDEMLTYFVLDSLDALRKNGRLTGMKALVASTLSIKPVCYGLKGEIVQKAQGIGIRKALVKMTELVASEIKNPEEKRLMISHVNCFERAAVVRDLIMKKVPFKDAIIVDTAGVSTTYAADGGIIVTC
ncbi:MULTISPECIES: DegV family protein [unclassified Butyrivibrio]|uniref:DegV family protein n=1 Tax=unclassified Butyrivibrio TaxID=2639466 RepID=UPI0008F3D94F|nr:MULTISPECIES: DegV family protein [unclassified Butyrivibrio]RKM62955.1 DegV family protein [Butyrivibrio sp. XB500-5]SFU99847.1 EDD domain protein, DegV family [Butyrivibrio sp. INlla21]